MRKLRLLYNQKLAGRVRVRPDLLGRMGTGSKVKQFVFLTALLAVIPVALQAPVIAIKAGKLLDPESASVAVNQIILVEESTIKSVGSDVRVPDDATVINLSRRTVRPGMFEAHTSAGAG